MMSKQPLLKFRSFFKLIPMKLENLKPQIQLENRQYMADYSVRQNDETHMPRSLLNVLNMIPHNYRSIAYQWLMTEGMRQAAIARREFVKKYNKEKGTNF